MAAKTTGISGACDMNPDGEVDETYLNAARGSCGESFGGGESGGAGEPEDLEAILEFIEWIGGGNLSTIPFIIEFIEFIEGLE
jgi:hypothetical protein